MKFIKTKTVIFFFLLINSFSNIIYSQNKTCMNLDTLKEKLINQIDYNKKEDVYVFGVFNEINDKEIIEGVYRFKVGAKVSFFILDKEKIYLLDITSEEALAASIEKIINYSIEKKYCNELVKEYISRMIGIYEVVNKYPEYKRINNCVSEKRSVLSGVSSEKIMLKMAEFLVDKQEIPNIDYYFEDPTCVFVKKQGLYEGFPEVGKSLVETGIYLFLNIDKEDFKSYIMFVKEGGMYDIYSYESIIDYVLIIKETIFFYEKANICPKLLVLQINDILDLIFKINCFDKTSSLP